MKVDRRFFNKAAPLAITLVLVIGYNNCGKVNFQKAASDSIVDPQGSPNPSPTPDIINNACDNPNIPHQTQIVEIEFPEQTSNCNWENDGNMSRLNNYFRARYEQTANFNLPPQSKICDMDFSFAGQSFRYDDEFIMTFNNMIMASSYVFTSYLIHENGAPIYDWTRIVGEQWMDGVDNGEIDLQEPYCLGEDRGLSQCSWPETDTLGTISMSFAPSIIRDLMSISPSRTSHDFKLIIIGDNDSTDCKHADSIQFTVTVDYVL